MLYIPITGFLSVAQASGAIEHARKIIGQNGQSVSKGEAFSSLEGLDAWEATSLQWAEEWRGNGEKVLLICY